MKNGEKMINKEELINFNKHYINALENIIMDDNQFKNKLRECIDHIIKYLFDNGLSFYSIHFFLKELLKLYEQTIEENHVNLIEFVKTHPEIEEKTKDILIRYYNEKKDN
jgi:hypothetical protein